MGEGFRDLLAAISRRDIWLGFALSDTRARYARSTLGPWWITLGTALGVIGLGLVWSAVMGLQLRTMLPNLAVGLVLWFMISGILAESSNCFVNQSSIIRNYPLPLSLHNLRLLCRHLINFAHNLSIVLVVFCLFGFPAPVNVCWAVLGLLLVLLNLWWISLLVATLGARFRDLGPCIDALMPVLFFLTPILYKKSDVAASHAWFAYNPLATLFTLVKNPLLSLPVEGFDYLAMALFGLAGWALALAVFGRHKRHIAFWI